MTLTRGLALGAVVLVGVALAFLFLRGGSTHRYRLLFINAGQIVKGDDVQIGGRRVGAVKSIELTGDNQAAVSIDVQSGFAPLHQGTTATIRQTSLSGIANRYIALSPGLNSSPQLRDGETLSAEQTTAPVDLDQIFNTLDPPTRRSLQQVIQGSATQYAGMGPEANQSARYFNPLLSTSSRLVSEAVRDQQAFSAFISSSSRVVSALAQRRGTLVDLVSNTNTTAGAIGSENVALSQALAVLPTTLRRANSTFVNLRATLGDLDTLVAASKPATRRLAPFLAALRPLVRSARPTIHDLRLLVHDPRTNNDLTTLTRKMPRLEQVAQPAFAHTITALQRSQPVLQFIRPYTPGLVGWLRDFGQGASNYDANGHYARIQPIFNAYSFASNPAGGVLTPNPPSARGNGLQTGIIRRCPGTASQVPADNSAPWRDTSGQLDCNPALVPPGP
ncbi:MAG TPA: MlaD family protein [Solirubrobacteraceae bacterium]|nr:MlaD family protein [Solirubrobacteraceae bacterium]